VHLTRPLFLNGMMGAGKSALGRAVAERARVPFVDLDVEVERRAGMSIREIFEKQGEAAFRVLERDGVVKELGDPTPRVIAVGGGSLLNRGLRLRALEQGLVLTLKATPDELIRRVSGDASRPMLGAAPTEARVTELLEARASAYAEAHAVLDTTGASFEALTAEVLRIAELNPIAVPLGDRTYAVDVVPGSAEQELEKALDRLHPTRVALVTDDVVDPLVAPRLGASIGRRGEPLKVVLPSGERHKTLASVEQILRVLVEAPVDRSALVVGVGGGVVTDIAGLAAALALRGLRWIAVPTTVLAMVDASVGGKTAVDLGSAKNAVGAFHQPSRVVVDPSLSRTETARAFRSGLAEVVKSALIGDPALFAELATRGAAEKLAIDRDDAMLTRAVRSSITVKAGVVGRDEREKGERAHLNLGHTVGHALEAQGGFERLTHGEAVSLGLVAALRIGRAVGVTPRALVDQVTEVLARVGLPVDLDRQPMDEALRYASYDKKRQGSTLRFVLVRAPGSLEIAPISPAELPALLRRP
jgi:shikimate kinase/3-dehydroquinate synthase